MIFQSLLWKQDLKSSVYSPRKLQVIIISKENGIGILFRMLIWQAIKQDLIMVTKDGAMKNYEKDGLKTLW